MTDVQIPSSYHQSQTATTNTNTISSSSSSSSTPNNSQAQKGGMNAGKFNLVGKNGLEIRGVNSASLSVNSSNDKSSNKSNKTSNSSNNTHNSNNIKSTNIHVYPIKMLNSNDLGAAASVNFIKANSKTSNLSLEIQNQSNSSILNHQASTSNLSSSRSSSETLKNFSLAKNQATNNQNASTSRSNFTSTSSARQKSENVNNCDSRPNNNNDITNINNSSSSSNNIGANNSQNMIWSDENNSVWTGTGVMSDRSSIYSIDDGDFDKEASKKVNNQLKEIDSVLYERISTRLSNIDEFKDWLEKFPHLRILGSQIQNSAKQDDKIDCYLNENARSLNQSMNASYSTRNCDTQIYLNDSSSIITPIHNAETSSINLTKNDESTQTKNNGYHHIKKRENTDLTQSLFLNGSKMPIRNVSDKHLQANREEYAFLEEEIFEQEGAYEELFAYDNQEEETASSTSRRVNLNLKRRRHGLTPITPKAVFKDLITNILFDHMWSELIDWSSDLIKTYAKNVHDKDFCENKQPTQAPSSPSISTNSVTRQTIIPLTKAFDTNKENSFPNVSLSRDNSNLNLSTNKFNLNEIESLKANNNTNNNSDLLSNEFEDLLKIKQLITNSNATSNNNLSASNSQTSAVLRHLNPALTQSQRVSSAARRAQLAASKKRYSTSEMEKYNNNSNNVIIVHGAGLGHRQQQVAHSLPTQSLNDNYHHHHHHNHSLVGVLNNADETNDILNSTNDNSNKYDEASTDEINILNTNNTNSNNNHHHNKTYYYSTFNYYNNHTLYHHHHPSYNMPSENSFSANKLGNAAHSASKPIRISSANNLKPIKERNERPMTSTTTRFESFAKQRSTTPSSLYQNQKIQHQMKVNGVRFSSDDSSPFSLNGNYLGSNFNSFFSTKSLGNNASSNPNINSQNLIAAAGSPHSQSASFSHVRRNSINNNRDASLPFQRTHK